MILSRSLHHPLIYYPRAQAQPQRRGEGQVVTMHGDYKDVAGLLTTRSYRDYLEKVSVKFFRDGYIMSENFLPVVASTRLIRGL